MELTTWLLYSGMALIAVLSPGPAVLLSVTNSLTHGLKSSFFSTMGNITGLLMVSGAAVLGLGAVLQASTFLFLVLKSMGAIYLIYMGVRQFRAKHHLFDQPLNTGKRQQVVRQSFVQGTLVAVSNPKAILFFTALFPQFINLGRPLPIQFFILTATIMCYSFLALFLYAVFAQAVKNWFVRGSRAKWLNRLAGTMYITFGLGILRLKNGNT